MLGERLPNNVVQTLASICPPSPSNGDDKKQYGLGPVKGGSQYHLLMIMLQKKHGTIMILLGTKSGNERDQRED